MALPRFPVNELLEVMSVARPDALLKEIIDIPELKLKSELERVRMGTELLVPEKVHRRQPTELREAEAVELSSDDPEQVTFRMSNCPTCGDMKIAASFTTLSLKTVLRM